MLDLERVQIPGNKFGAGRFDLRVLNPFFQSRLGIQRIIPKIALDLFFKTIARPVDLITLRDFVDLGDLIFLGIRPVKHERLPEKINTFSAQRIGILDMDVVEAHDERLELDDVARKREILRRQRVTPAVIFQEFDRRIGLLFGLTVIDAGHQDFRGPGIRLKPRDDPP